MHQPNGRPLLSRPDERQAEQHHAKPLARVQVPVGPDVALLVTHPQQLIAVDRAAARHALGRGKHGQTVAAVDHAGVGQQVAGQQEAKD